MYAQGSSTGGSCFPENSVALTEDSFSEEHVKKFERCIDEGYNQTHDACYNRWLKQYHLESLSEGWLLNVSSVT